jgi:hypothetical protein
MKRTYSRLQPLAALFTALISLLFATVGVSADDTGAAAPSNSGGAPIVNIYGGAVRGIAVPGGYVFRGQGQHACPRFTSTNVALANGAWSDGSTLSHVITCSSENLFNIQFERRSS